MIIKNAIQTPDGTILISRHRHDFASHKDTITGKLYFTDGGLSYQRMSANGDEIVLSVLSTDPHDTIREAFEWGSYGKDGDEPLQYIKLKDMETEHIKALLLTLHEELSNIFENELAYRGII